MTILPLILIGSSQAEARVITLHRVRVSSGGCRSTEGALGPVVAGTIAPRRASTSTARSSYRRIGSFDGSSSDLHRSTAYAYQIGNRQYGARASSRRRP
jgi:hypothetical protein